MEQDKQQFQQQVRSGEENNGEDRIEQFNELSELSLEERMNVADQIGVPVRNESNTVEIGTLSGSDDAVVSDDRQTKDDGISENKDY